MRKPLLAVILIAFILAILASVVRIQPPGTATLIRNEDSLVLRATPLFLRARGVACRAATIEGRPSFDQTLTGRTATMDEIRLRVRFTYSPPARLPSGWPGGDWCQSLQARVATAVERATAALTHAEVLADLRLAGDRAGAAIEAELRREGLSPSTVSVRTELPAGFARARTLPEVAQRARKMPPVLFLGLDGADWQLLDEFIANGTMPNLARIVTTGSSGVLETEHPPLSPLIWTTMMTGQGPLDHGILDFTRFNPQSHEKEPITSDERRVPAIWNMLTAGGKTVAVFGLWATYAAEPVHGINVSDRLFTFLSTDRRPSAAVVYPDSRQAWASHAVDVAEQRVDGARLREYLPALSDSEAAALGSKENPYSDPAAALRRILVETEIYRTLSLDLLSTSTPDVTILYIQGTDSIGHVFSPFAPPRQPSVSEADFNRYSAVPQKYFREIDHLLGEIMAIAEQRHAVVMLASDHGFYWREGRPAQISSTATATAAKWHRTKGIYALWGPGVPATPGHASRGGVRQVCATLLSLAGLPAATDGTPPLPGSPPANPTMDYDRFFQRASPPPVSRTGGSNAEEIAKLRALGYIGSGESSRSAVPTSDARTAGSYNNAGLLLRDLHRTDDALRAFEHALQIDPKYSSAMWNLSETLFLVGRDLDRSDALLVEALRNGMADATHLVAARTVAYRKSARDARPLALLDAAVAAAPGDAELRMFRGSTRMERHECDAALEDFQAAANAQPRDPLALASTGLAQLCMGREDAAQESFRRSLALDPNQPMIRSLLR
ncbi:MAG: alkaline phosphatase family protein [Thermoanaerobaculia bacterium]